MCDKVPSLRYPNTPLAPLIIASGIPPPISLHFRANNVRGICTFVKYIPLSLCYSLNRISGNSGTCIPPLIPFPLNLPSPGTSGGAKGLGPPDPAPSKLESGLPLKRAGSVTAATLDGAGALVPGAHVSQSVSKWNQSGSFIRSPAADVVGVSAVCITPGDWEGPLRSPDSRRGIVVESGRPCEFWAWEVGVNVAEAGALVATGGTWVVGWERKKLATGSLEELLIEPVGVFGTGSGSGYETGAPSGFLPTMT